VPIAVQELETGVTKIVISGRMDLAGCGEIEMPLSLAGGSKKAVVVDLAGVSFMASLGLRSIVLAGKAIQRKGGKIVILSPQPIVEEVIVTSGVDEMIPIFREESAAIAAVAPLAA
jgi:anti-sigma B factor antagonist